MSTNQNTCHKCGATFWTYTAADMDEGGVDDNCNWTCGRCLGWYDKSDDDYISREKVIEVIKKIRNKDFEQNKECGCVENMSYFVDDALNDIEKEFQL